MSTPLEKARTLVRRELADENTLIPGFLHEPIGILLAENERLGKTLLAVDEVACFICNGPRPDGYSEMIVALDEATRSAS